MVNFFNKSKNSSSNLDASVEDTSPTPDLTDNVTDFASVPLKETSKKRNPSDGPSPDEVKKPNLNSSPTLAEKVNFVFDTDSLSWVIQLFTMCENMSSEIKNISTKFDKFERFQSQITKRVSSLESKTSENKKRVDLLEKNLVETDGKLLDTSKKIEDIDKGMGFMNEICEGLKSQVSSLSKKNSELLQHIESLSKKVDTNEQHNRSECLLLHGVPETSTETPTQSKTIFVNEIGKKLGIPMKDEYVRRAHRLGQRRGNGSKPRPIIARLWSPELRNDIYTRKKACKNSPISITENLTKKRVQVKKDAESRYGDKNVWTKEGRIYAKDGDQLITVLA